MKVARKKKLVVKVASYQLIAVSLYKLGADEILQRCVVDHERSMILVEAHDEIVGGHYVDKETRKNILCVGL
jgi:hypothetical protein